MSVSFRLCATAVAVSLASAASFGQPVGEGVQAPSVIGKSGCGPNYPAESMRLEESGTVRVKALVEADGLPSQVKVEGSSGFERLDRAAVDAVSCFRFAPGSIGGIPTPMWVRVPIRFALE
jgi:TonB family protein